MSGHNGDETFERWFREHHTRLLAQCRRIVGDAATAEDIAQETLLRAWLGRERMREEDLGAWLTVVARNLCISHLRRQKKQIPTEVLPETPDEHADPAHVVARLESRRAVRRAMRGMGERHRVLLFKREIEGADYDELSADLGLSAAGTRTVLFRARRVLKDRLAAAGEGLAGIVLGVRLRTRSLMNQMSSAMEGAASPILQVGIALTVSAGLLATAPAIATSTGSGEPRAPATTVPTATVLGEKLTTVLSAPQSNAADLGARERRAGRWSDDGEPPLDPGLDPDGDLHPSVNIRGVHLPIGDVTWEECGDECLVDPYPWEGSKVHKVEAMAATWACKQKPIICD